MPHRELSGGFRAIDEHKPGQLTPSLLEVVPAWSVECFLEASGSLLPWRLGVSSMSLIIRLAIVAGEGGSRWLPLRQLEDRRHRVAHGVACGAVVALLPSLPINGSGSPSTISALD